MQFVEHLAWPLWGMGGEIHFCITIHKELITSQAAKQSFSLSFI